MAQEEIPVNFRCPVCDQLAVDALKLYCCTRGICPDCLSKVSDTCPLCSHQPISKDECKPHLGLRKSIRHFLKKKQKAEAPQAQPNEDAADQVGGNDPADSSQISRQAVDPNVEAPEPNVAVQMPDVQLEPSEEVADPNSGMPQADEKAKEPPLEHDGSVDMEEEDDASDVSSVLIRVSPPPADPNEGGTENDSGLQGGSDQKFAEGQYSNQSSNNFNMMNGLGNFNGWGMNGAMNAMNAMNPMMAMQNGMGNFDQFQNMMNMGGMMNPAMMQQMQNMMNFGGGFNGMGMSNMNGMNGMGGMNMGQMGFDNGFGGWGMSNNMGAMNMRGDFGNNAHFSGPRNNRGSFGRGRGRNEFFQRNRFRGQAHGAQGFPGRKSSFHNHQYNGYAEDANQDNTSTEIPGSKNAAQDEESQKEGVPSNAKDPSTGDDGSGKEILKKYSLREYTDKLETTANAEALLEHEARDAAAAADSAETDFEPSDKNQTAVKTSPTDALSENMSISRDDELTRQDTNTANHAEVSATDLGPNVPQGPAAQYAPVTETRGRGRGGYHGYRRGSLDGRGAGRGFEAKRGGFTNFPQPEPAGVGVVGAPTGPKALREGGPNIGFRGRGNTLINARGSRAGASASRSDALHATASSPTKDQRTSTNMRHDRSPSPTEPRSTRRYSRGARDTSDYDDYDRETDHKHRHSRKYEKSHRTSNRKHDDLDVEVDEYRSHRDKEKYRSSRHERDRSDDRKRHKHRDPSYDQNDYYTDKHDDKYGKSYERSSRHHGEGHHDRVDVERGAKHHSTSRASLEDRISRAPPTAPTGPAPKREFKIQGRSKQSELEAQKGQSRSERSDFELAKERIRKEKPNVDVYTLEREARQRERLLKEEQRRGSYGITNANGQKRSHDQLDTFDPSETHADGAGRSSRKKSKYGSAGRRSSHKFDGSQDMAAMMDRAERERESARY
ncbi:MAG: hypothetical protein Q9162_006613 [Coniocarpon cinnabarinum]